MYFHVSKLGCYCTCARPRVVTRSRERLNRLRSNLVHRWGPASSVACKSQLGPTLHVRTCTVTRVKCEVRIYQIAAVHMFVNLEALGVLSAPPARKRCHCTGFVGRAATAPPSRACPVSDRSLDQLSVWCCRRQVTASPPCPDVHSGRQLGGSQLPRLCLGRQTPVQGAADGPGSTAR